MSLESKLEELNTNFDRLLALLAGNPEFAAAEAKTVSRLLAAERHDMARPQADIGISTRAKASEKELEPETIKLSPEEGKPEPTYDEVKKYILQISAKSRDKAVALLARYGAKGGPSLKPEQYASFVKDALATLAGVYDPEKGE